MQILREGVAVDAFFDRLSRTDNSLLMLDYDGTLAPFVVDRDRAAPYRGVGERLEQLASSDRTRLVIVSGREVARLKELLGVEATPELFGCHGAEHYHPQSGTTIARLSEAAKTQLKSIRQWSKRQGWGDHLESKPTSVAWHVRGLDEPSGQALLAAVKGQWPDDMADHDLELHEFDGGVELRPRGVSKGDAVRALLDEGPDDIVAAYLGDDVTDEDAFAALGSRGLKVLVRDTPRDTLADIRLTPPAEMLEFLDRWLLTTR